MELTESVERGILTLVEECPSFYETYLGPMTKGSKEPYVLFCTISPNPKVKIPCFRNGKSSKIEYGALKQVIQYRYCMRILRECYLAFCDNPTVIGVSELQPISGNVHYHFLLHDRRICNDQMLQVFRKDVLLTNYVQANLTKKNAKDYMNNIVKCHDVKKTIRYLAKDDCIENRRLFPVYYREKGNVILSKDEEDILLKANKIISRHTKHRRLKDKDPEVSQIDCSASTEN